MLGTHALFTLIFIHTHTLSIDSKEKPFRSVRIIPWTTTIEVVAKMARGLPMGLVLMWPVTSLRRADTPLLSFESHDPLIAFFSASGGLAVCTYEFWISFKIPRRGSRISPWSSQGEGCYAWSSPLPPFLLGKKKRKKESYLGLYIIAGPSVNHWTLYDLPLYELSDQL